MYTGDLNRYFEGREIDRDLERYLGAEDLEHLLDSVGRPLYEAVTPLHPMTPSALLFRGLARRERETFDRLGRCPLAPSVPLRPDVAIRILLDPDHAIRHVTDVREAGKSFSLQERVAWYYGTSGGKHDAIIAVVQLPLVAADRTGLGSTPTVWSGPEVAAVDPRHLQPGADFLAWQDGTNRARIDSEILLVSGSVEPVDYYRIRADQCPTDFVPWAETPFANPRFRGASLARERARVGGAGPQRTLFGKPRRTPFGMAY